MITATSVGITMVIKYYGCCLLIFLR